MRVQGKGNLKPASDSLAYSLIGVTGHVSWTHVELYHKRLDDSDSYIS